MPLISLNIPRKSLHPHHCFDHQGRDVSPLGYHVPGSHLPIRWRHKYTEEFRCWTVTSTFTHVPWNAGLKSCNIYFSHLFFLFFLNHFSFCTLMLKATFTSGYNFTDCVLIYSDVPCLYHSSQYLNTWGFHLQLRTRARGLADSHPARSQTTGCSPAERLVEWTPDWSRSGPTSRTAAGRRAPGSAAQVSRD